MHVVIVAKQAIFAGAQLVINSAAELIPVACCSRRVLGAADVHDAIGWSDGVRPGSGTAQVSEVEIGVNDGWKFGKQFRGNRIWTGGRHKIPERRCLHGAYLSTAS